MAKLIISVLSVLITLTASLNSYAQPTIAQNLHELPSYYEMGMEKYHQGHWKLAIRVWQQGIKASISTGEADPRLGFILIQSITRHDIESYFPLAQQAYYWSLKQIPAYQNHKKMYQKEARRLMPIMNSSERKRMEKKIRNDDPSFLTDLRNFWERQDPVLNTDLNERLLEHWQRIATARNKYQKTNTTVYGTDDRGLIYIKYGDPQRIYKGTLTFDQALFRTKASELIDLLNPSPVQSLDSTSSFLATGPGPSYNKDAQLLNLTNKAREYFRNPSYEVWIYNPAPGEVQNTIFIFGQNGNSGRWEQLKSMEELIPNSAFGLRGDQARTMGIPISPGLIMQVMTYHQLSHLDEYFLKTSLDLESKIFSSLQNNSLYMDVAARNANEFALSRMQAQMPAEYSDLEQNTPNIELNYTTYRMIGEDNKPKLLVSVKSNPHQALLYAWAQKPEQEAGLDLDLIHALKIVKDGLANPVIQSDTAEIYYSSVSADHGEILATNSLFMLDHDKDASHTLSAELIKNGVPIADTSGLSGLGSTEVEQPDPLSTNTGRLEMSDLILGYGRSEESSHFLPFILSFDHKIPQGENLTVHFEVYHLSLASGTANFTLNYKIHPVKKGLAKLFGRDQKQEVALTLNFSTTGSRFSENLEIETGHLQPGVYELQLTATDPVKKQKKQRTISFEIIK